MVFCCYKLMRYLRTIMNLKRISIIILIACGSCSTGKNVAKQDESSSLQAYIDAVDKTFAPDKRTVLFDVTTNNKTLTGETTSAAAKAALLSKLDSAHIAYTDSIHVLPAAGIQEKAVVTISVANLRLQPSHKAEMATQATLGTPLQVFKKEKNWYYVQTPDHYLAWVDSEAIQPMDNNKFAQWHQQPKLMYTSPYGFAYAAANDSATVCDLAFGDVLSIVETTNEFYKVALPDGRIAFVHASQAQPYEQWKNSRQPSAENFANTSKKLMGVPYLWGGTSFKAVDCSGFTKTVYFMNGLVLPRDASQQINLGEEVDTNTGWQNLQQGDLLFFGIPAKENTPERVVHVGLWIGNNEFIHASGKVRITSLDPAAHNYDAYEHKRFLRAKRITPQAALYDLRKSDIY